MLNCDHCCDYSLPYSPHIRVAVVFHLSGCCWVTQFFVACSPTVIAGSVASCYWVRVEPLGANGLIRRRPEEITVAKASIQVYKISPMYGMHLGRISQDFQGNGHMNHYIIYVRELVSDCTYVCFLCKLYL
ncbi:hypothetical protein NMG60_11022314 [Bertholletia excelsa]